eukprot:m.9980 g.9980  ORF g.9980 m.9980 type:complete len:175 (+) comp4175_c0_seq1:134-658(+)
MSSSTTVTRPTSRSGTAGKHRNVFYLPMVTVIHGNEHTKMNTDCRLADFHDVLIKLSGGDEGSLRDLASEKGMLTDLQSHMKDPETRVDSLLKKGNTYILLEVNKDVNFLELPSSYKKGTGKTPPTIAWPEDNTLTGKLFNVLSENTPKDFTIFLSSSYKNELLEKVQVAIQES